MATLFVYGSLALGQVHYKKIEMFAEATTPAIARGSVHRLEVGYPVFAIDSDLSVRGQLVTLKESPLVFPILDELHGYSQKTPEKSLFHRVTITVDASGQKVETFVYAINLLKLPKTARKIEDGDWEANMSHQAPVTQTLTEVQRRYISRLGASTGREIVPINLELYRELLGKGLIVDKGRRLALTSLGKEVYRYLD